MAWFRQQGEARLAHGAAVVSTHGTGCKTGTFVSEAVLGRDGSAMGPGDFARVPRGHGTKPGPLLI